MRLRSIFPCALALLLVSATSPVVDTVDDAIDTVAPMPVPAGALLPWDEAWGEQPGDEFQRLSAEVLAEQEAQERLEALQAEQQLLGSLPTPDELREQEEAREAAERAAREEAEARAAEAAAQAAAEAAAEREAAEVAERAAEVAEGEAAVQSSATSASVWDQLAQCESGGNWSINTGNGYYGGLQFHINSWRAVGGSGYPHEASRETQIAMAERLLAEQGWGAWPACSSKLGLR